MKYYQNKINAIENLCKNKIQYLMILPTTILILLFGIYPLLYILYYSFTQYDGFGPAMFIGLDNYIRVFKDASFWVTVSNTIQLGLGIPLIQLPSALLLAVLLNKKFVGSNLSRAIIFIPNITSSAIMGVVFFLMFASFNGVVNGILQTFHIIDSPIEWFGKGSLAKLVIILFCTWNGVGFYMVLFLSALQRIPADVYESARIDGANNRQLFFKITIPMMGKLFQIITSLSILNALKLFDSVKALTNGGPGNTTEVMTMYIFRYFFENPGVSQQGYASATSIIATLIILFITGLYYIYTKKVED